MIALHDPLFPVSDEDRRLLAVTHEVCRSEIVPIRHDLDEREAFPERIFDVFREVGLFESMAEAESGGLGLAPLTRLRIAETVAQYCLGVATSFYASACLASLPIQLGGSPEQRQKYLPALASGESVGAFAVTEPEAGSDILNLTTTATKRGDSYVLNGLKQWITNAGRADIHCVFARTGPKGCISCFIVEKGTAGLSFGKLETKLGIRCSHTRQVILNDVVVPAENLVGGEENMGLQQLMTTLSHSRVGVAGLAVGLATGAYEEAVKYSRRRRQFGRPLIRIQALQHALADMLIQIETARSLTYRACLYAAGDHPEAGVLAAMTKCYASEIAMQVATGAVQVHGGNGYSREFPVEKMFRDAKVLAIYEGANEVLKNQIGDHIARSAIHAGGPLAAATGGRPSQASERVRC